MATSVLQAAHVSYGLDDGLEDIRIIVGMLTLNDTYQALKAHSRIYDIHGERLQMTVGLTLILHEHDVPYLYDLWIVLVDQVAALHIATLLGQAVVDMYLRTGTARTCIAHLPEVVMLVTIDDVVGRHMLEPILCSLIISLEAFLQTSLKDSDIEVLGIELEHIHQVFPCHIDGSLLEVIAKGPVAQHLKHGMVISIVSHLFQVVMLSTHTKALLAVCPAAWFRIAGAQDDILPLIHTCVGKHQRGVILDNHRSRRYNGMSL